MRPQQTGDEFLLLNRLISRASFWQPDWLRASAWIEHIPFAFWITENLHPRLLVELGTHTGTSYCAFCQAVDTINTETRCFAVDTWEGDDQAGFYGAEVLEALNHHNETKYARFSSLLRARFDEAVSHFADGSIDLLHIDGYHDYDTARHDWDTWHPKLSPRAVVLFHDTNVRKDNFGVHRLWAELSRDYPHFEFHHGNGLGVLGVGAVPGNVSQLFKISHDADQSTLIRTLYARLGAEIKRQWLDRNRILELDLRLGEHVRLLAAQKQTENTLAENLRLAIERASTLEQVRLKERAENRQLELQVAELSAQSNRAHAQLSTTSELLHSQLLNLTTLLSKPRDPWQHFRKKWLTSLRKRRAETRDAIFRGLVTLGWTRRHRKFQLQRDVIKRSELFDKAFYRDQYRQLLNRATDPLLHYIRCGAALGCNPNPLFDTKWYLHRYPEVAKSGKNPLVHYIEDGAREGLNPGPFFDAQSFLAEHPELRDRSVNPLAFHLNNGNSMAGFVRSSGERIRVVFLSGEPDTPGSTYRVEMPAKALNSQKEYSVLMVRADQIVSHRDFILQAHVLVIWRLAWTDQLAGLLAQGRGNGQKVVFDADDYLFDPAIARIQIIDGIRSTGTSEESTADHFERFQKTLLMADICTAPTETLAARMREFGKPAFVLTNGFDQETHLRSRQALGRKRARRNDNLIRIGYAGGTRTHQKDFLQASAAVGRILRKHPQTRLVVFHQDTVGGVRCLDIEEFPEIAGLESQIEWRPFVPLRQLPDELARFDINLAPLEIGNIFCEAKSELKYFEAALAEVPTIASPTIPYQEAIEHGETGFLARNAEEWFEYLDRLTIDKDLRDRIGKQAFFDVFWKYGPERRTERVGTVIRQFFREESGATPSHEWESHCFHSCGHTRPVIPKFEVVLEHGSPLESEADLVIPLYNYALFIEETLESLKAQSLPNKGLIVVDDCSTDGSLEVAKRWIERNSHAFRHVALLKNTVNSKLSLTRNAGFSFSEALFVMPVDADNLLQPGCLESCLRAIQNTTAAVAYPTVQEFGEGQGTRSCEEWHPSRFVTGNYLDSMALIRRSAWAAVGGYDEVMVYGWEDYDLWAKFVEQGFHGIWVKGSTALYRVHSKSMLHTVTDAALNKGKVVAEMSRRHPWLQIPSSKLEHVSGLLIR